MEGRGGNQQDIGSGRRHGRAGGAGRWLLRARGYDALPQSGAAVQVEAGRAVGRHRGTDREGQCLGASRAQRSRIDDAAPYARGSHRHHAYPGRTAAQDGDGARIPGRLHHRRPAAVGGGRAAAAHVALAARGIGPTDAESVLSMFQCGNDSTSSETISKNVRQSMSLSSYLIDVIVISVTFLNTASAWPKMRVAA